MNLEFDRVELAKALGVVSSIVPRPSRKENPSLQCVRIQSVSGNVYIQCTDNYTGIRLDLPSAKARVDTDVLVPAKQMASVLKEMSNSFVRLEVKPQDVRVWDDINEFIFPLQDISGFPDVKTFDAKTYYRFPADDLKTAIRRTIYATDPECSRYALGGILFDFSGDGMVMVATDSRRLAMMPVSTGKKGKPKSVKTNPVVPTKAMRLVGSFIRKSHALVQIAIQEKHILFKIGDATIVSCLIEGRFPKYQDCIPKSFTASIPLQADLFRSVVRRSKIMTSSENRGVDFDLSEGALRLTSQSVELGRSRIDLPVSYNDKDVIARFDPRFIADFLKPLASDTSVNFKVSANDPCMLTTADGYACLLMPMSRD